MKSPSCGFSKEGVPFTALSALLTLMLAILGCAMGSALMFVVTALVAHFFRDPERVTPAEPGLAVSPADGKVCKIGTAKDPVSGEERKVVCVFMNVFNVHVNRCPVAGEVQEIKYFPGKFLNASLDKASEDNERLALSVRTPEGEELTVVQIAGLIARRIVCWAEQGDELARGQRFGLIKFGSRLDLYLPDAYEVDVKIGDKVFAGQTVLARRP
ncbi:phosphatidylserine decarboxylase family protein [Desulfocurvus sp. DL9XJH121]